MSNTTWVEAGPAARRGLAGRNGCRARRALLLAALLAGAGGALAATGDAEAVVASTGAELTRLLRFMALVKGAMALGAASLLWWRLELPASCGRMAVMTTSAGVMAAGPVLIWDMAHVGLGALLLHGGLAGTLAALWRDPAVVDWLGSRVAARRRAAGDQRGGTLGKASTSPV